MAQKQTAVVVVSKEWVNTVRFLVNEGRPSRSTGDTHMLIAPIEDASDHRGLWLSGIVSRQLTQDGSPVTMKFMVPWSFVYAFGIVDDERANVEMGFVTHEGTMPFCKTTAG